MWRCPRCGEERPERFTWAHKPRGSRIRTCGGEPVLVGGHEQVDPKLIVRYRRQS
jgi:hypothetical protein